MTLTDSETYSLPLELSADDHLSQLHALPYKERRRNCWGNFKPRLERLTYRYSFFNSKDKISIKRAKDVLLRSCMWLSAPQDFNDPFDCRTLKIKEKSVLKKRAKVDLLVRRFDPQLNGLKRRHLVDQIMTRMPSDWFEVFSKMMEDDMRTLGAVCFPDDPRSLLMWSVLRY